MGDDILDQFTQLRSIGGNGLRYIGYVSASFAIRPQKEATASPLDQRPVFQRIE